MTRHKYGPWKLGTLEEAIASGSHQRVYLSEDNHAYREIIEPKRETVTFWTVEYGDSSLATPSKNRCAGDNIKLTIPFIDGKPDFSQPIQWEKVQ